MSSQVSLKPSRVESVRWIIIVMNCVRVLVSQKEEDDDQENKTNEKDEQQEKGEHRI